MDFCGEFTRVARILRINRDFLTYGCAKDELQKLNSQEAGTLLTPLLSLIYESNECESEMGSFSAFFSGIALVKTQSRVIMFIPFGEVAEWSNARVC